MVVNMLHYPIPAVRQVRSNKVWVIVELTSPATSTEELNNVVHQNARIIISIHRIWQNKRKTLSRCVSRPRKD